jgi:hypothetical protein
MKSIKSISSSPVARVILKHRLAVSAVIAVCAFLAVATKDFPQNKAARPPKLNLKYDSKPWADGTPESAARAAKMGATIPLSTYSITVTKDNERKARTGTIAGTSPFASTLSGSTINAIVIPLVFTIGSSTFDPTALNPAGCADTGASAMDRFMASPLVVPVTNLTFNGVNVGTTQYIDGFMRAEFWNTITAPAKITADYTNPINFSRGAAIAINPGSSGITSPSASGCLLGVVSDSFVTSELLSQILRLQTAKIISTTQAVFFMMANVVLSTATPPTLPGTPTCCIGGYHTATGTTPQFWSVMNYNTRALPVGTDVAIASHEIGEFMNDPLGSNGTPLWGDVGQVPAGSCQGNFEVGDPLTGTLGTIDMNNYSYHLQELAFFSWFFNSASTPSLGAGGKFSSNGTFAGPSKICPPGGTN